MYLKFDHFTKECEYVKYLYTLRIKGVYRFSFRRGSIMYLLFGWKGRRKHTITKKITLTL
jgi:hypothetical protein